MTNPFLCERCGAELESDDAVSVIEGVCDRCRQGQSQLEVAPAESQRPTPETSAGNVIAGRAAGEASREPRFALPLEIEAGPTVDRPAVDRGEVFTPPRQVLPGRSSGAGPAKPGHRTRDLAIGTSVGLLLTGVLTVYYLVGPGGSPVETLGQSSPSQVVNLRIQPRWAVVKLDGEAVGPADKSGKLPISLPEDDGATHWLEVTADGFHSDRRQLSAILGVSDVFIELLRKPCEVAIRTTPPQAEVWVDDELKGLSPLSLALLSGQKASLSIKRQGYVTVSRELTLSPRGRRQELHFALQAVGPVLTVETDPAGAEILVDGVHRGVSPVTVDLAPRYRGREVEVAAAAAGYDDARMLVLLPYVGEPESRTARLTLEKTLVAVELLTVPPGGQVVVDGKELGTAPVVAKFEPSETGRTVIVQSSLAGSYYGRQELVVPPAGEPLSVTITMAFNARRVALLLSFPAGSAAGSVLLREQALELIHRLTAEQRFAILAQGEAGIEAWPGGLGTLAATSEQKVRAYDMIRSVRPAGGGGVLEMMRTSLGYRPSTIWLFATGELSRREMGQFSEWAKGQEVSVHLVRAAGSPQDDWLEEWVAGHHGTLTVLGRQATAAVALDDDGAE